MRPLHFSEISTDPKGASDQHMPLEPWLYECFLQYHATVLSEAVAEVRRPTMVSSPQWASTSGPLISHLATAFYVLKRQSTCRTELKLSRICLVYAAQVLQIWISTCGRLNSLGRTSLPFTSSTPTSRKPPEAFSITSSMTKLNKNGEMGHLWTCWFTVSHYAMAFMRAQRSL